MIDSDISEIADQIKTIYINDSRLLALEVGELDTVVITLFNIATLNSPIHNEESLALSTAKRLGPALLHSCFANSNPRIFVK